MTRYIELDQDKINRLKREAQQFQDDIVCGVGTDFMQKIAEAENRMIFDILKGLEADSTANVVPKSEVETLEKELVESYRKLDESVNFYCSFTKSKIQNCPIDDEVAKAKQEVAREIFDEIEKNSKFTVQLVEAMEFDSEEIRKAKLECYRDCLGYFQKLKKKYTESEDTQ